MARSAQKYVRRVQAMFTERQYELLREYAQETDTPVGTLVRETVEESLITDLEQRRKQKALEWMASQHLPIDDWETVERQMESRWEECEDE
ncbi:MAG: hypothetical protein P8189_29200 [Anaerolineae bacterium]|jgi:hypothetical protein